MAGASAASGGALTPGAAVTAPLAYLQALASVPAGVPAFTDSGGPEDYPGEDVGDWPEIVPDVAVRRWLNIETIAIDGAATPVDHDEMLRLGWEYVGSGGYRIEVDPSTAIGMVI